LSSFAGLTLTLDGKQDSAHSIRGSSFPLLAIEISADGFNGDSFGWPLAKRGFELPYSDAIVLETFVVGLGVRCGVVAEFSKGNYAFAKFLRQLLSLQGFMLSLAVQIDRIALRASLLTPEVSIGINVPKSTKFPNPALFQKLPVPYGVSCEQSYLLLWPEFQSALLFPFLVRGRPPSFPQARNFSRKPLFPHLRRRARTLNRANSCAALLAVFILAS
jgi:hypothetical protein